VGEPEFPPGKHNRIGIFNLTSSEKLRPRNWENYITGWICYPDNTLPMYYQADLTSIHNFGVKSQCEDHFSVDYLFDIGQNHAHS